MIIRTEIKDSKRAAAGSVFYMQYANKYLSFTAEIRTNRGASLLLTPLVLSPPLLPGFSHSSSILDTPSSTCPLVGPTISHRTCASCTANVAKCDGCERFSILVRRHCCWLSGLLVHLTCLIIIVIGVYFAFI